MFLFVGWGAFLEQDISKQIDLYSCLYIERNIDKNSERERKRKHNNEKYLFRSMTDKLTGQVNHIRDAHRYKESLLNILPVRLK